MAGKRTKLTLSEEQVKELEEFIKDPPSERIGLRASMVLDLGTGMTGAKVAEKYGERPCTVSLWKKRYEDFGLTGFLNHSRGRTKDGYGQDFQGRLQAALDSPPADGSPNWNVERLASLLGVPEYGVRRHLKKLGINLDARNFIQNHQNDEAGVPAVERPGNIDALPSVEGGSGVADAEAGNAPEDDNMMSVSLFAVVKDKSGKVYMVRESDLGEILADPEHFDVSTVSGFRRDYGRFEQGMINGFAGLLERVSEDYTADASKKKQS